MQALFAFVKICSSASRFLLLARVKVMLVTDIAIDYTLYGYLSNTALTRGLIYR